MGMEKQITAIVDRYIDSMTGNFANRTLARKIVMENPGIFDLNNADKEIEKVRNSIRYRRGSMGTKNRKEAEMAGSLKFVRKEMKPSEYMAQFMGKGDKTAKPVWVLPKKHRKVLVLSDLHIPYHHLPSIESALNYGFGEGIDSIYINGDLIDFAKISRWAKNPKVKSTMVEIDMVRDFLEGLSGLGVDIYYKLGNHEDRWERYIIDNTPEFHDLDVLQMENVLGLRELGIELIDSKQRAKFGHLSVLHGHEFGQSIFSPVNPARGLFLRAKSNVLAGHNHQSSSHHENDLKGEETACFSTGCLCDLEPEYRPFAYTKWNHGAAIVDVDEDGWFSVDNFRIIDGKIVG